MPVALVALDRSCPLCQARCSRSRLRPLCPLCGKADRNDRVLVWRPQEWKQTLLFGTLCLPGLVLIWRRALLYVASPDAHSLTWFGLTVVLSTLLVVGIIRTALRSYPTCVVLAKSGVYLQDRFAQIWVPREQLAQVLVSGRGVELRTTAGDRVRTSAPVDRADRKYLEGWACQVLEPCTATTTAQPPPSSKSEQL